MADTNHSYFDNTAKGYSQAYEKVDSLRSFIFDQRKALVLGLFDLKEGKVLDIGCGPGVYTDKLSEAGYEIYGVDPAKSMIEIARSKNFPNSKFFVGKAENIDFPDSFFDGVLCVGVLEYLDDRESGIREIARVTKAGGIAVFTVPNGPSILNLIDVTLRSAVRAIYRLSKLKLLKGVMDHEYDLRLVRPKDLNCALKKYGFEIEARIFHIFRLSFLSKISPRLSLWLSKKMNFIKNPFVGINYIVKCRKK